MTDDERRIVGFTSVAHGLTHAVELVYGAVLLVVAIEFDVSIALLGAIANASAIAYSVMALPAGQAADKLGSKKMVTISVGGSGAAALLAAAAPNVAVLTIALVIMGVLGSRSSRVGCANERARSASTALAVTSAPRSRR
jgi:MFS family permease